MTDSSRAPYRCMNAFGDYASCPPLIVGVGSEDLSRYLATDFVVTRQWRSVGMCPANAAYQSMFDASRAIIVHLDVDTMEYLMKKGTPLGDRQDFEHDLAHLKKLRPHAQRQPRQQTGDFVQTVAALPA